MRILILALAPLALYAQLPTTWTVEEPTRHQIVANITYGTQNNYETKLDVYRRRDASTPQPTLIFIHGGGWVGGSKDNSMFSFLPFLEMGWNVVNVEYRLGRVSLAPAAVEDCLCALRWVAQHAREHNIDLNRLVVTGESAGGHLSLTTGMIPQSAGLDRQCPGPELPKVAAIINWYGITDVNDLLDGPNQKTYTVAKRVSPLQYVRSGQPPVLTIHGDADPTVPYSHATRLKDALTKAGVPNKLYTVAGGGHGNFKADERVKIYATIREFLAAHVK
jgi:acetyl esterase/lipase